MTFARVLQTELRKCVDTRASRWLLVVMVVLCACALAINTITRVEDFADYVRGATLPMPALLPIVAILAATGDWTQRSAMTTFALVPRRSIVLAARLAAAILLIVAVAAAVALVSVVVFLLTPHARVESVGSWATLGALGSITGLSIAAALTGVAAGFLLLNTPVAITVTILLPILFDILVAIPLPEVAPWISILAFSAWMTAPEWSWWTTQGTGVGIGPALTSFLLFIVVPIGVGWKRQSEREAK